MGTDQTFGEMSADAKNASATVADAFRPTDFCLL